MQEQNNQNQTPQQNAAVPEERKSETEESEPDEDTNWSLLLPIELKGRVMRWEMNHPYA